VARRYTITVEGTLSAETAEELAPFQVQVDGTISTVDGARLDQSALRAVLRRLDALGLIVLSVTSSAL
jgi:hypothetical protein